MDNKLLEQIKWKINKKQEISPCLFLGQNSQLLNAKVQEFSQELIQQYNIPKNYIYTLKDNGEKIKISEIKEFINASNSLPGYEFQIFIIENISRLTIQSANSCLKFFEEPWAHNIIFLTNTSESGILETILSRVHNIHIWWIQNKSENQYFQSLLQQISQWNKQEAITYFYNLKAEKQEYIQFLENIILFAKKHFVFLDILDEVESDIQAISQNNVNAKYIIDKYLLTL